MKYGIFQQLSVNGRQGMCMKSFSRAFTRHFCCNTQRFSATGINNDFKRYFNHSNNSQQSLSHQIQLDILRNENYAILWLDHQRLHHLCAR